MPPLAELQRNFADAVRSTPASVAALDVQPTTLAVERRVAIYRNHHRISLTEALAANFPTVRGVIGDQGFQAIAVDFIAARPPSEPHLSSYGAGFPEFLARDRRLRDLLYLADVARMDWAFNLAERADDVPSFGPAHLESAQSELAGLMLTPHPSLSLIRSSYPLLRIRDLVLVPEMEQGVSLTEGAVDLMIWRRDSAVSCQALDASARRFVESMADGIALSVATDGLASDQLAGFIAAYLLTGAFAAPVT